MDKIKTIAELKMAIHQLEFEQDRQCALLKDEFYAVSERFKPVNILKDTWKDSVSDIKIGVTDGFLGIASGLLARKMILGKAHNPVTKFLGVLIEKLVSNSVVKNAGKIKALAGGVLEQIKNKHD